MGLKIGGLTDYVKLGGAYETFTNDGEAQVDKGFLEMISKSDGDDLRSKVGTIGLFDNKEFFERFRPIVADGADTGGISGKTGKDKYRPYIMSERPAEYDFRTGKWEYSDTKKRPDIIV